MDEKKETEEIEVRELMINLHSQHKDVTAPFLKRMVELKKSGDGDGVYFLLMNLQELQKLCIELIRAGELVAKETWEKKH